MKNAKNIHYQLSFFLCVVVLLSPCQTGKAETESSSDSPSTKVDWKFTEEEMRLFSPPMDASPETMLKWSREQDSPLNREKVREEFIKAKDYEKADKAFHEYREKCMNLTLSVVRQILETNPPFEVEKRALQETWFPLYLLAKLNQEKYLPQSKEAYKKIKTLSQENSSPIDEKTVLYFWLRHPLLRDILEFDPTFLPEADEYVSEIDTLLKKEPFGKYSDDLRYDQFQFLMSLSQNHEKYKPILDKKLKEITQLYEQNKEKFSPDLFGILFWSVDRDTLQGQNQFEQWAEDIRKRLRNNKETKIWDTEQQVIARRMIVSFYGNLLKKDFSKSNLLLNYLSEMENAADPQWNEQIAEGYRTLWVNRYEHFAREGGSDEELEKIFEWIKKNIEYGQENYDMLGDTIASRSCLGGDPFEKCTPKQQEYFLRQCVEIFKTLTKLEEQWKAEGKSLRYKSYAATFKQYEGYLQLPGKTPTLKGTTLSGDSFDLEKLRGKTVLLDFWATWCGPCIKEIPEMKNIYEKYRDQGFEIVGISIDDNVNDVKGFLEKTPISWPMLHDDKQELFEQFHGIGIPHCLLIDSDGQIIMTDARGQKLQEKLAELYPAK